jgi:hypothetical protein
LLKMCTKLCRCLHSIALLSCRQLQTYTHHLATHAWIRKLSLSEVLILLQLCLLANMFLAKVVFDKHVKRINKQSQFIDNLICSNNCHVQYIPAVSRSFVNACGKIISQVSFCTHVIQTYLKYQYSHVTLMPLK